VPELLMCV